jgi:hypothetical protein
MSLIIAILRRIHPSFARFVADMMDERVSEESRKKYALHE